MEDEDEKKWTRKIDVGVTLPEELHRQSWPYRRSRSHVESTERTNGIQLQCDIATSMVLSSSSPDHWYKRCHVLFLDDGLCTTIINSLKLTTVYGVPSFYLHCINGID